MRFRSVATVFLISGSLAAALVRCSLPAEPPGPQVRATNERLLRGAMLALPASDAAIDRPALVASLRRLDINTVILQASASQAGSFVDDRVSLAIELQRELGADVYIGTYQSSVHSGKPLGALLQKDPAFSTCYAPDGARVDGDVPIIDKLVTCSEDTSRKIVQALQAAGASPRIGCYISHEPELTDSLTGEASAKLNGLLRNAAGPCIEAGRRVAVSPLLSAGSGSPAQAGLAFRESLRDSGIGLVILQDGISTFDAGPVDADAGDAGDTVEAIRRGATRAASYYTGLRVALADRQAPYGPVEIWANVEGYECDSPDCARTRPTSTARFTAQLCAARARVDGIVTFEYLHHLAERPLVVSTLDGSASAEAGVDDALDAAVALREGYLAWREAGASCALK